MGEELNPHSFLGEGRIIRVLNWVVDFFFQMCNNTGIVTGIDTGKISNFLQELVCDLKNA
jgi:hypothetical protein